MNSVFELRIILKEALTSNLNRVYEMNGGPEVLPNLS